MESFTEHEKRVDLKQLKTDLINAVCASMIAEPRFDKGGDEADSGASLVLRLVEQIVSVDPEFILKLAVYVRNDLNIRSTANFLVALAANYKESSVYLKKYFKHVINLPSDWLDVAALYQMLPNRGLVGRALPTALRKAMMHKFHDFDTYQLGKYNKQGKIKRSKQKAKKAGASSKPAPKQEEGKPTLTLKQMVRQLHLDAPVYHVMCLLGKKYPANETDFRRSGLPGMFEPARAGTRMKLPVPETWETLLSAKGNKAETWEELIDHRKLPFMAMLRNLRNLILTGVEYKYHRWAMNKLNNEETIARSKQFPFRFFSAYEAIAVDLEKLKQEIKEAKASGVKAGQKSAVKGKKGAKAAAEKGERKKKVIVPKNMPDENLIRKYREALDNAVKFATVHNVKPIRGNTVVFCSVAQSMANGCKSAKGMGSVRTLLDVGVLLGLMCKYMCEECDFRIVGAPGNQSKCHLGIDLSEGTVLDNMKTVLDSASSAAFSRESFQFPFDYLENCILERKVIDNLIVLNDSMLYPEQDARLAGILNKYRQEVNPELMFVSVNLGSAGKSMESTGAERHPNDVLISGFSDAILRYIAERGDSNQLHYIDHIDKEKGIETPAAKPRELKRGFGYSTSSSYSNPFRSRIRAKPFSFSGRKSFLFDDDENEAAEKAERDEEARRKKAEEEAEEREIEESERKRIAKQMEKVRSGKWRAVRVFVSSTFRDMHGERDYLVRQVFPELRERCRKRRLHFYDVDLRWGVTQEEAETEGALHICLNEIDRCRPFFIGLLGERYGWRPSSYVLPEEPRYVWAKKYPQNRSITELEMVYGALRCPEASEPFFYFRDPNFTSSISNESVKENFLAEDKHAHERLIALKQEIKTTFPARSRHYSCNWAGVVGGKPMVDGLEKFGRAVLTDLWQAICCTFPAELDGEIGTDERRLQVARECHEEYAVVRTRVFVGRDDLIKTMTKFVDGDEHGPLVISGEPGSGKSSLIAQFMRLYTEKDADALVIAHYAGAATEACDLRHTLLRIALELKERLQLPDEIPEEDKELRQVFGTVLESAGFAAGGRKVVLLIDGLNQMEANGKAQALDWLPGSTRVRMLVSTHVDSPSHRALRHRKPQPPEIVVGPLEENHRKSLVRAVLAEYRKKLDESPGNNQMRTLLRKSEAHKPLYLVLACEELRLFGVYEQLSNRIKSLGGTVAKLFDELLHRLEGDHDKETLKLALSLLVSARAGLLETELMAILARERKKEAELPRAVWARIFAALQPFFRPVGPSGEDALTFFHAQMEISVRKRYFSMKNNELRAHKQLANHFVGRARKGPSESSDWEWIADRRAISELPHHLVKSRMWEELESVLCDLAFVELKCRLGMAFDLLNDYNEALATEHVWDGKNRLEQFQAFFAGNAHILGKFPDLTLQQAANQPDSSVVARSANELLHKRKGLWVRWLNKPQGQSACQLTLASERDPVLACAFSPNGEELVLASRDGTLRICDASTGAERATLLGHTNWVVACTYSYDGGRIVSASWDGTLKIWDTRAGVEMATLRGHTRRVNACAYSDDGLMIASASWDCTVRLWDGYSGKLLKTFNGHTKPVNAVAFSPDGTQLVSASWDSTIKLWNVEEGTEIRTFSGHSKSVRSVQFSPTGAQIVSTSVDTTVRVWDARTGAVVATLAGHSKAVNACSFSPDGRHLVSASDDQTVKVWDALGGREITRLGSADLAINACDISPDGRRIVAALADCTATVWDVLSGEQLFSLKGHTRTINAVAFSPGGTCIVTASDDSSLKVWSSSDGSLEKTLSGHRDCVNDVCFSPNGAQIVSASDDFTLCIWAQESGALEKQIQGHTNRVTGCSWSPDGKRVASSSRDNTLRIWNPTTGEVKKIFKGHMDWLTRCTFSPDSKKVVSCSWDFNMKLWDVRAGKELATLRGHMGAVSAAAFSADGKYMVSSSLDGTLKIWDPVKALEVTALRDHSGRVTCVRFAKTGSTFVSSSEDGTVRLWDAEAGQEITTLQGHSDSIRQVKYCPDKDQVVSASDDCTVKVWNAGAQREISGHSQWVTSCALGGRLLATASRDGTIKLWDSRTSRLRSALEGHSAAINGVAISPDGTRVASASDDATVAVWDSARGDRLRLLRHHTNSVRWVCFSPDGQRLASAAWDNTVCVTDPDRPGSLLLTLRGHTDWVNACAFSPNGSRIASASHDRTVILWDATTGARIYTTGQHSNWVVALAFSPDSQFLASASYDAAITITDTTKRTSYTFRPHAKRVSSLAFTADGSCVLSASHDGSILAHRLADILNSSTPEPVGRFFTRAPATALCSSALVSAAGDSLGNVYQIDFEA